MGWLEGLIVSAGVGTFFLIKQLFKKKKKEKVFTSINNAQEWSKEELDILDALNSYRVYNGLNSLKIDKTFHTVATSRTRHLAEDHEKGKELAHRISYVFSILIPLGVRWATENIARGYSSVGSVMNAWKNSPSHNKTMLYTSHTWVGIASYNRGGKKYFVCVFGH